MKHLLTILKKKPIIVIGLLFNTLGALLVAISIKFIDVPACGDRGCLGKEVFYVHTPVDNPFFLKLGLLLMIIGFALQLVDAYQSTPK